MNPLLGEPKKHRCSRERYDWRMAYRHENEENHRVRGEPEEDEVPYTGHTQDLLNLEELLKLTTSFQMQSLVEWAVNKQH